MTVEEAFDILVKTYPWPALGAKVALSVLASFAKHIQALCEEEPEAVTDTHLEAIFTLGKAVSETYTQAWSWLGIEWYDHRFDWLAGPDSWAWLERCTFAMRHIRRGDRVLDLCCGDGFAAGSYYSKIAAHVDGLDSDPGAIELASKLHKHSNVEFYTLDAIRDDFPQERYDVVLFFAAIEHFPPGDGQTVLRKVAGCLGGDGVLFGSTPLGREGEMHPNHQNEFTSPDELHRFLSPYFEQVEISVLEWSPDRTELYFTCKRPRRG